jgi:putative DNA primase/helicase
MFGDDVRYVADREAWFVFDDRRWAIDTAEVWVEAKGKALAREWANVAAMAVADAAKAVAEATDDAATAAANKKLVAARAELAAAKRLQDMRNLRRMLAAARSESNILVACYRETFDRHPWLLNCTNGTVDLTTATMRPHKREDYITRLCPVEYVPLAEAPTYRKFLTSIFAGNDELVSYVCLLSGVVLTGDVSAQTLHLFLGDGSNGKSVLLETWLGILGRDGDGYGLKLPDQALVCEDKATRHPTEIADLAGSRLAVASETGQAGRLDESRVKELTGGDTVTARKMRENFFRFDPSHKLVIASNHKPRIAGTDHGIWRRVRLVPFSVKFWKEEDRVTDPTGTFDPALKADPEMGEKLRAEAPGILAEMVWEAFGYYRSGRDLTPPKIVTVATNEYRQSEDVLGQFFAERVRADPNGHVQAKTLYGAFKDWAETQNHKPVGNRTFSNYAKGHFDQKKSNGVIVYLVRLVEPNLEQEAA